MADYAGFLSNPKVRKLERLPDGWRYTVGALTAPNGWRWANNGKSIFSGERETALIRDGE